MNPSRFFLSAALATALAITGCEKKGSNPLDSGSSPDGPANGTSLTSAQRAKVFTVMRGYIDSVGKVNPSGVRAAVLKFFSTAPEFKSAGMSSDSSVYAVFTDGRIMIFSDNMRYDGTVAIPPLSKASPGATNSFGKVDSKLPASADAYLIDTSEPAGIPNPDNSYVMQSTRWLNTQLLNVVKKSGYIPHQVPGTIKNLKSVKNAGLFHMASHGGWADPKDGSAQMYSIMTTDQQSTERDTTDLKADLDARLLTYFTANNIDAKGNPNIYMNYGITPAFIAANMTFSDNSLVVMTACTSYNPAMLSAFSNAHASVYIGWDNVVLSNVSDPAAAFIFDRCLGTSLVTPKPVPPQRPFAWGLVLDDLSYRGYTVSRGSVVANLKYSQLGGDLTVLLPSIMVTSFTQYPTELRYNLQGEFTSTPGTVLLDGVALNLTKAWKDGSLETTLPTHGGNIQVTVNGALSNVVQLSEYRGHFTYTDQGNGTLQKKVVADINFLADIHKYRVVSGANQFYKDEAAFNGPRLVAVLSTSHASYEASGSYQGTSWGGAGTINNWSSLTSSNLPQGTFNVFLGDEGGTALIELITLANYTVTSGGVSTTQIFGVGDGGTATFNASVGTGYVLKGNRVTKTTTGHTYTIEWGDISPLYPPLANAAR
jgi:hypothetical protein